MTEILASNQEVLVKTEPFLQFKKKLFKVLIEKSGLNEEILRRKFYKILDAYLNRLPIDQKEYKGINIKFLMRRLDNKFKKQNNGSFVVQGMNVGYLDGDRIVWVRYSDEFSKEKIKTFL